MKLIRLANGKPHCTNCGFQLSEKGYCCCHSKKYIKFRQNWGILLWKVVQTNSDCSIFAKNTFKRYYTPGTWVEGAPNTEGITCFRCQAEAKYYKGYENCNERTKIIRLVSFSPIRHPSEQRLVIERDPKSLDYELKVVEAWTKFANGTKINQLHRNLLSNWPNGTVMAKKVWVF